jgi:predicted nucleotide-binding protein (sugar kinase/HSP70/actin superfamily)
MFACPCDNVFIGSINTIGEQKDVHYICNVLAGYIETIKDNNIVQISTNNALNMRNVINLLVHHFPNFTFKVVFFIVWTCYWKVGGKQNG